MGDFLELIRPNGGLIVLTALFLDKQCAPTKTFELPGEMDAAIAWARCKNEAGFNVYYQMQLVRERHSKRITKADVEDVPFLHLDFDWRAGEMKVKATPGMIASKVAELHSLRFANGGPYAPSIIVCSGNGVQALWRLETPVSIELAERANLALLDSLDGDPGTYDGARLLRLPGFTNWPKRRNIGIDLAPAYLIESNDLVFQIESFPLAEAKRQHTVNATIAAAREVDDADLEALPARLVEIIREGQTIRPAPHDQSRSGWCMYGVCWLVGLGIDDATILGILSNALWCIGDSLRDATGRSFEDAARRTLARARDFVAAGKAEELRQLFAADAACDLDFSSTPIEEGLFDD